MRVRFAPSPDRRAAHRRREDGTVQLAARPRLGRHASCCASRTPTASARRRRTSSRSSTRCAGSSSTGTRARSRRPSARARAQGGDRSSCSTRATPTRTRARSGCACPTRARRWSTTSIRGDITFPHSAIEDFVIARSDGSPLYNLAVAVDDHDMGITHVVRGDDHISNTPRQLMILEALGRRAAPVRAPAAAARPRRQEALQAPRRGVGAGAARRRATCPRPCATTCRCSAGATTSPPPS